MTPTPVNPALLEQARALAARPSAERIEGLLVLGGGYTGQRLARVIGAAGIPVTLTRRTDPGGSSSHPSGPAAGEPQWRWLHFDGDQGALLEPGACSGISHVLVTIPPDAEGEDPCLKQLGAMLRQLPLQWLGYLSTTGVYGNCDGRWVGEDAPALPGLPRSQARLACEQAWRASGLPLQIFRLPAIYGAGRCPFQALAAGRSRLIHKPGQVFSRIHVDDIVGALLHNLALPAAERPAVLNVVDDHPCPSSELLAYAAHLAGCRLPQVESFEAIAPRLSPMALGFWSENRRASNHLLCRTLGYRLLYPSFREGLRASWEEERWWSG